MKKILVRFISLSCIGAMLFSSNFLVTPAVEGAINIETVEAATETSLEPYTEDGVTTWTTIYFGNYHQRDDDGDGNPSNDTKEPIKWRILDVDEDNNKAFILADAILDFVPFNETGYDSITEKVVDVTWNNSTIRSWLNGYDSTQNRDGVNYTTSGFLVNAFSETERLAIVQTTVEMDENSYTGAKCLENTEDYIYILSETESRNTSYGLGNADNDLLYSDDNYKGPLCTYTSDYACLKLEDGADTTYNSYWLRTPSKKDEYAVDSSDTDFHYYDCVYHKGVINFSGAGIESTIGVRPCLWIDLSKDETYWLAGTVSSDGTSTSTGVVDAPRRQNNVTTWDVIMMGSFYTDEITEDQFRYDVDYYINNHYYKNAPLLWRVLSVDNGVALVVSDKSLVERYYSYDTSVLSTSWEESDIRSWLNGYGTEANAAGKDYTESGFVDCIFDEQEKAAIVEKNVSNISEFYGADFTSDKMFLLSRNDLKNTNYGFYKDEYNNCSVYAEATDYYKGVNPGEDAYIYSYMTRTPGYRVDCQDIIYSPEGEAESERVGYLLDDIVLPEDTDIYMVGGVRPAFYIDLTSDVWTYVGTVNSEGTYSYDASYCEHEFGTDVTVTTNATCHSYGEGYVTCALCGYNMTVRIDMSAHLLNVEVSPAVASTCTTKGKTAVMKCAYCDYTSGGEELELGAHIYKEVTKKAATCGETGIKENICTVCNAKTEIEIPKLSEHTYDKGVITKAPTTMQKGVKTYTCTVCHATKTEEIAALEIEAVAGQKMDVSDQIDTSSLGDGEKIAGYYIKDSAEKKLAKVSKNGVVTPKKSGVIHVTAYKLVKNDKGKKEKIDVDTVRLEVVVPKFSQKTLRVEGKSQIDATKLLEGYEKAASGQDSVVWKTSKKSVAEIDAATGMITPLKNGKSKITVTFNRDGKSVSYSFNLKITKIN